MKTTSATFEVNRLIGHYSVISDCVSAKAEPVSTVWPPLSQRKHNAFIQMIRSTVFHTLLDLV